MSLDANDLILFARVVEAGSFAGAAERTGLPKSTLSRRIGGLEARLGERLLVRSTRRLAVTDFGERLLDHARRLLEETEAATALALEDGILGGRVDISSSFSAIIRGRPVHTVSQSEAGFEKIMQAAELRFDWLIPDEHFTLQLQLTLMPQP